MNRQTGKVVRWTTVIATVTTSYFFLTADYGPEPNALDPIKNVILSAQHGAKDWILGKKKVEDESGKRGTSSNSTGKENQ